MKYLCFIAQSLLAVLVLALTGGCSTTMSPVHVEQKDVTGGQVLPYHVALVINPELTEYKHRWVLSGGDELYPIGDALRGYAINVATKSFRQVDVVPSEEKAASLTSADLILIPRAVKSDTTFTAIAIGHGRYFGTLVVEWTARNRSNQKTVWLKTLTSNATRDFSVFSFVDDRFKLFQDVFDDLNPQTYKAFQGAAPDFRNAQP
jgi:hypothetical protein